MLWEGTYFHLWFMPVALATCLLVEALRRATLRVPTGAFLACVLALSPALLYAGPALRPIVSQELFQWVWVIPAAPVGVAFGRVIALERTPRWGFAMLAFSGTFAAIGVAIWWLVPDSYPLRFALGALLIGIGFALPFPSNRYLFKARTMSAGIFLCHPLVMRGALRFFEGLPVAAVALLMWLLAGAMTLGMQRTSLARFFGAPPESAPDGGNRPSPARRLVVQLRGARR
jgi:hypothetical protein